MSIASIANAPASGHRLIEEALIDLHAHDEAKGGRQPLAAQEAEISQPIPVYRLPLDRARSAGEPDAAEHVGWRYVVRMEADKFSVADLNGVRDDGVRFASFSDSPLSQTFVEALHVAQREARKATSECEIRSLDIPALYAAAIWVTSTPPVFIPYLTPKTVSSEALGVDPNFLVKLKTVANRTERR